MRGFEVACPGVWMWVVYFAAVGYPPVARIAISKGQGIGDTRGKG